MFLFKIGLGTEIMNNWFTHQLEGKRGQATFL